MQAPFEIWMQKERDERITFQECERASPDKETELHIAKHPFHGVDNQIVTLQRITISRGHVTYNVSRAQFREHYVLNKTDAVDAGRDRALELGIFPLTALALTTTIDGYILFGQRSGTQVSKGNHTVLPGGYMHPWHRKHNDLSLDAVIQDELREELNVEGQHIVSCCSTGLVFSDRINRGFTSAHQLVIDVDSETIQRSYDTGHDPETSRLICVRETDTNLLDFVTLHIGTFSNHALGVLLCSGRKQYGEDFYDALLRRIEIKHGPIRIVAPGTFEGSGRGIKEIVKRYHPQ